MNVNPNKGMDVVNNNNNSSISNDSEKVER